MPGDPVGATQADPLGDALATMDARVSALEKTGQFPAGFIGWTAGTVAPPSWLVADGSAFDMDRYAALAVVCPTGFLPNLIDRFPVGAGNLYTLLTTGGAASVTLTGAQSGQPAIAGGVTGGPSVANTSAGTAHSHGPGSLTDFVTLSSGGASGFGAGSFNIASPAATASESAHTHTLSAHTHTTPAIAAANAASAHSVLNPYVALTPLIHV